MRNLITNLVLLVLSFLGIFLILEFIIFRIFLPAADLPQNEFVDGIIKYVPNQTGIFRCYNDYNTAYNINSDGWNSRHDRYIPGNSNKYRIAIIGDSYVEALRVDYRKSLAEQLEDKLGDDKFEVYRFGISGAPLSQYWQMLRKEVVKYAPDFVIIVLVHNDFDESYQFVPGRYTSSFLKISIKDGGILGEIQPQPYKKRLCVSLVRNSAIFRYLVFNRGITVDNIRRLIFREKKDAKIYQANIDIKNLDKKMQDNEKVTEYLIDKIKKVSIEHNFNLLFIMDGDRNGIYNGINSVYPYNNNKDVLNLNKMAKTVADKYGLTLIDLQPIFQQDYRKNHIMFNYVHDFHWNEYGHKIAAETIFKYLRQQNIARGN